MSPPVLIFIHNHRFETNLEPLERIYGDRFSRIHHLMPFYSGSKANVHRVYESSHQFQGFFAQAAKSLLSDVAPHYIFCGDDLLLNPRLNEGNVTAELSLDPESAYIKGINSLTDVPLSWPHAAGALLAFAHNGGVEWERELPPREQAMLRFEQHKIAVGKLNWRNFRNGIGGRQLFQLIFYALKRQQTRRLPGSMRDLPYPLANSYSDFFVVPRASLASFCHLCGVFAAMNLFAEVAIPTALLLTTDRIVRERGTELRGVELWSKNEVEEVERKHERDLHRLLHSFPHEQLYLHPVKLSRWQS